MRRRGFPESLLAGGFSGVEDFGCFGETGQAFGVLDLAANGAFGLEATQFGERAAQDGMGLSSGPVD